MPFGIDEQKLRRARRRPVTHREQPKVPGPAILRDAGEGGEALRSLNGWARTHPRFSMEQRRDLRSQTPKSVRLPRKQICPACLVRHTRKMVKPAVLLAPRERPRVAYLACF